MHRGRKREGCGGEGHLSDCKYHCDIMKTVTDVKWKLSWSMVEMNPNQSLD
jgi:hypothetical protein